MDPDGSGSGSGSESLPPCEVKHELKCLPTTWAKRKTKMAIRLRSEDPYGFDTDPVHRKKYKQRM